ncbi:putative bacteriophage baseplate protein [Salmonella enterica]|uniref:Putative bacteriophage baseplate protein n=1 Tax=Salmonella sp. NCTC 6947 TaxID=2583581 RepID=A0A509B3X3_9ENTR|nr:putative bacteriophage baseplate protein [Salmonella enterica]
MNGVIFATGTVSAIDPKTVRARVRLPDHDNLRTWWLDVMQNNTYKNKDYCLPDVGEQVKVLMTPDGVEGLSLVRCIQARIHRSSATRTSAAPTLQTALSLNTIAKITRWPLVVR